MLWLICIRHTMYKITAGRKNERFHEYTTRSPNVFLKTFIQEMHSRIAFSTDIWMRKIAVRIINECGGETVTPCTIRTCTFIQPAAVWNKDEKESHPSLSRRRCHREGTFTTLPTPRKDRVERDDADGLRERGDWSIDSRARTLLTCTWRVSPWSRSNRLRYYRSVEIRDTIQTSRARQTIALLLDTKDDGTEEMRQERGDCEASRRWSALDLASVRSLAGPSCSPVLICFLLPLRHHPSSSPRDGPFLDHPLPPRSRKRGFRSPPVLAAASCCRRCCETPERRRRMRTLLITLVVLYAPEEKTPSLCRYCPPA